jgi:exonuclease SbcD
MTPADAQAIKPLITICHLADVHLGYRRYNRLTKTGLNQREVDVSLAFQEAITRIISLRPDIVVIAGDLFHSVRPSNAVVTFCFRQLRRLTRESGAQVVIVGGNHEAPKRVDTGSVLQIFSEIEGVFVADAGKEVFVFPEKGLAVTCLPHAAFVGSSMPTLRADDRYPHNILVAHAQVNEGWVSDFGGAEVDLKMLNPHEWDYIALGHVHVHRVVGRQAVYAGSLEHTSTNIWGEARELKGFIELSLPSAKRTFHPLTSPRDVVVIEPVDGTGLDPEALMARIVERVEGVSGGTDGKIVHLALNGISREGYRNLDHKALRQLRSKALHMTIDVSFVSTSGDPQPVQKPGKGLLKDQLLEFSKSWEAPGITHQEISEMLERYLTKVEAAYEAS